MSLSSITFPCASYVPTANADIDTDNAMVGMMNSACKVILDNLFCTPVHPVITLKHGWVSASILSAVSSFEMGLHMTMEDGLPTGGYTASVKFRGELWYKKVNDGRPLDIYELVDAVKQMENEFLG